MAYRKIDLERLEETQKIIAKKIVLKPLKNFKIAVGIDCAFSKNKTIACAVLMDRRGETLEKTSAKTKTVMPYIPTFLSFREFPAMASAFLKLKTKPDVVFVNGNGILHPRMAGLASHFGVVFKIPTVGVAQKLLCGNPRGENIHLYEKIAGKFVSTVKNSKPIVVSPGNLADVGSSVKAVLAFSMGHKLPEPLHVADMLSKKAAKNSF